MLACRHAEPEVNGRRLSTAARASRLHRLQSINRIAVVPPTIEAADQLLYTESKLDHIQRTFGGAVAPNPIAVRNDQSPFVEVSRRRSAHRSMWDIDGAGNMA